MSERICPDCGCVLSKYNPEDYCAACAPKQAETDQHGFAVEARFLEGEELLCVIAGILFVHRGMRPGKFVILQHELRSLGIEATTEQIHKAKEKLERRGLDISATARKPGYVLRDWLTPALAWATRERLHKQDEEPKVLAPGPQGAQ